MASELQKLVDSLGRRLDRSVAIDDRSMRLLAHTSHKAEVDEARVESIMQRAVSPELVRYLQTAAAAGTGGDLFVVPPAPELGLTIERVALPIRYEGAVLGYLWLLSGDGSISDDTAAAAREVANSAALVLHREHLVGELSRVRKRELLRDLLSHEPRLCLEAADRLIEEELLASGPPTVIVAKVGPADDEPIRDKDGLGIATALERVRQTLPPRTAIQLERPDHAILVMVRTGSRRDAEDVARELHRLICAETGRAAAECQVGVGEERRNLADAHASYLEAVRAADVSRIVKSLGPVVLYSRLEIYGLLAELPTDRLSQSLHPGLRRLLDAGAERDSLAHTLEVFLDAAGNVTQAAAQLCVHRATVYYRLERIEEVAGVSLADGNDRLALHLGLKIAHLVGLRRGEPSA